MKELFRKVLLSTFAIGATLFIGNNVFAQDYKVNIAVIGDKDTGKTQIIRRIFKEEFQEKRGSSPRWDHGVYGKRQPYVMGKDTFYCRYYDAPGYLQKPDATLDQQIESKAIKEANIALIVVDPQQKAGMEACYLGNSLQEAFVRHVSHVFEVNPKCKIIVVANKIDEITDPTKLAGYRKKMGDFRSTYEHCHADGVFTSAKTGVGIPELEKKVKRLLALNKAELPKGSSDFVVCKCGHTHEGTRETCERGYDGDLYCSLACLKEAEAKPCSRGECKNKEGRFLKCKAQGYVSSQTGKMYCDRNCYQLAEEGEPCARGWRCPNSGEKYSRDKKQGHVSDQTHKMYCSDHCCKVAEEGEPCTRGWLCPNRDKKYYHFRDKKEGRVSEHTDHMYCSEECYIEEEGTRCNCKGCDKKFVVADGEEGKDYFTSPATGKKYCTQGHMDIQESPLLFFIRWFR